MLCRPAIRAAINVSAPLKVPDTEIEPDPYLREICWPHCQDLDLSALDLQMKFNKFEADKVVTNKRKLSYQGRQQGNSLKNVIITILPSY